MPKAELSPTSLYNPGKEAIERLMSSEVQRFATDPTLWAEAVVRDLSKSNPPHWVFQGKGSRLSRIAALLPVGTLDYVAKSMSGLDVFEKNLKATQEK